MDLTELTNLIAEPSASIDVAYKHYYMKKYSEYHTYPVEWVVRVFLGSYPYLKMNQNCYKNSKILDLGFGDGRNFPLLYNLGFEIFGIEISEEIIELARSKFAKLGIPVELMLGRNSNIPQPDKMFDYILGCHSIYYVDPNESFSKNLSEIARVLKPNGFLIASLPKPNGSILKNARSLANGHVVINHDPLKLRNGYIFRVFETKYDIEETFSPYFEQIIIGSCEDDFFGIQQNIWTVICLKKSIFSIS
jgi:ubiquinone/menaquinone biosynthesis C-methylase UbiE